MTSEDLDELYICVRIVPRIGVSALGLEQAHRFHIFEFLRAGFFSVPGLVQEALMQAP